jgi:hypothetical protein
MNARGRGNDDQEQALSFVIPAHAGIHPDIDELFNRS